MEIHFKNHHETNILSKISVGEYFMYYNIIYRVVELPSGDISHLNMSTGKITLICKSERVTLYNFKLVEI